MKLLRVLFTLLGLLAVPALHAATITVANTNDDGAGSLRQALQDLASNGQANTIDFDAGLSGQAIVLTGSELVNLASGGTSVTIDASALPKGITIQRDPGGTGKIIINTGIMTLRALTIRGARDLGLPGGGVANYGTLTIDRCTLTDNQAHRGGAIYSFGTLTMRQCTVAGNSAPDEKAGGLYLAGGTGKLVHCTVYGNSAWLTPGLFIEAGSLELENSIVAENTLEPGSNTGLDDVANASTLTLTGLNIVSRPIDGIAPVGGGFALLADPQLAPLADNGGPTLTMMPLSISPATDQAVGSTETIDQRGKPRPIDGDLTGGAVADIGSVEYASNDADLASLIPSAGALSPDFSSATTTYTVSVPYTTDTFFVTPTADFSVATITVNGTAVSSGNNSDVIGLSVGDDTVTAVVTAQDGSTKVYNLTVTRTVAKIAVEYPAGTNLENNNATVPFGIVNVGSSSAAKVFKIKNIGTEELALSEIVMEGINTQFSIDRSNTVTPVAPGGSTTFKVTFNPAIGGDFTKTFRIVSGDPDESPFYVGVTGTGNRLPVAPDGAASTGTGDQLIITLPFTSPDADGDTVTLDSTAPDSHLTVNGTNGSDVTITAASNYVGDAALGYTVTDGRGGTVSGTITVTIADNDPPVINPHADVNVLAPDSGGIVVNYAAATATDNITANPAITYSKESGTLFPVGTTTVTINAKDEANNNASPVEFSVNVHLASAEHKKVLAQGEAAPGQGMNGLPGDAVIASFNVPATDDDDDIAFVGKWTSTTGPVKKGTGLFLNDTCLAVIGGDAAAVGGMNAKWKSFTDPVVEGGKVVCIAKLSTGASAVVSNFTGSALEKIAITGEAAADVGDAKFKKFATAALRGGSLGFLAQITGGTGANKVTPARDMGMWIRESGDVLHLIYQDSFDLGGGKIVQSFVTFQAGLGSPGQGRGWLSHGGTAPNDLGLVLTLNTFTDKTKGIVFGGNGGDTFLARTGESNTDFAPELTDASFATFRFPAMNDALQYTFYATMKAGAGGVTKADAGGIFAGDADFSGPLASSALVAQVGHDAGATGAKFSVLKDPVLSEDGGIAFPATIKGSTVKGLNNTTLWWRPTGGGLILLAQAGANAAPDVENDLPANAQWKSFTSLAIAGGRGPIFTGTLVPNKGGVTATTATGVWAVDFQGKLRTLFRTGDSIDGKTLKSFTVLKTSLGSTGVTRNFNTREKVVWLATFKEDKSQAIITTQVP